ncbi:MAG TPA: putative nucleotidyltransferase substrate binding domain-containing protein [Gordonia sp. (in: high G+C Gram-positive bacteria)]|uniref:putative nucleotidyltransferase substrate binding domain-containing protein n=1 Tax=unclassified Gordonia (in: high G+C Gram-positive bacteria) TaxID=2657482 RepID=UPI000F97E440|nr:MULTISPECIES: putative nucleotidyltransferase substrate binding domain-containing protein [unclassified Gordonia (in: high G+C Gram-positive bacteria)]RTL08825.1 MAG: hypothetical protein EKK62_05670 [Acidimicrobiia bacterium]HNP56094.1 putative nucleotidyltransferase substrate binding domain-containing protein [Gordonia sp. (in: high G+C Gram-positive bacteria)]HRC49768.1 putative nucleotidyltransferase substrate binding domain-containing protein [Gordonia sp. (in: high G+C Gram-positive bac
MTLDDHLVAIRGARTADELVTAIGQVRAAPPPRAGPEVAALWWSGLVRVAADRAVDLVGPPEGVRWHWFVTGSCGRGEALPGADVETLAVFDADGPNDRRNEVFAQAARVHELLENGGLAGDSNGATASRARCCRTREEWVAATDRWAQAPQTDRGVVMAGLMLDSCAVGETAATTGDDPKLWMREAAARHRELGSAMAQDATASREVVPARLAVLTGRRDSVDIKQAVIDPIVRLARLKAVLADSAASATTDRLSVVDEQLTDIDWDGLVQAYRATTVLRWTLRSRRWEKTPRSAWDIVTLGELAPHDRAALRSAGREVLRAQRVVRYQWRLL